MNGNLDTVVDILSRLVACPSVSGRPNHDIVGVVRDILETRGIPCSLSVDASGERANVFATVGPSRDGGVVLCGHMDVVPVDGQHWQTDPFRMTRIGDRLHGRGTVDMKGFLACVLASVPAWQTMDLSRPIHIAFTYDEEIGGFGMPVLLRDMAKRDFRPGIVIVGEPTGMKIVSGHKGAIELHTVVTGLEAHSCNPFNGVNAIACAMRLVNRIEEHARRYAASPVAGSPYDPPFPTLNVGRINGGTARNITSGWCEFDWEIRMLPGDNGMDVVDDIRRYCEQQLVPEMRLRHPEADIVTTIEARVPGLDDRHAGDAVDFVRSLTGLNTEDVVSFGTDAGYFSEEAYSTIVFGPGSIDRAHKPDEYIELGELAEGLEFLGKVGRQLAVSL